MYLQDIEDECFSTFFFSQKLILIEYDFFKIKLA